MAQSMAPMPPRDGQPATQEGVSSFRVKTAALSRPAGPIQKPDPNMVLVTAPDGGVVVYPPSEKLVILAGRGGDKEAAYAAAGVGDYIFAGADVLATLDRAWKAIG